MTFPHIRTAVVTAALLAAPLVQPAMATELKAENASCQEALRAGLPDTLEDTQIRFQKRRGAGKKQRLFYTLSNDAGRGKATCIVMRGEIQELQYDDKFRMAIAAAQ